VHNEKGKNIQKKKNQVKGKFRQRMVDRGMNAWVWYPHHGFGRMSQRSVSPNVHAGKSWKRKGQRREIEKAEKGG